MNYVAKQTVFTILPLIVHRHVKTSYNINRNIPALLCACCIMLYEMDLVGKKGIHSGAKTEVDCISRPRGRANNTKNYSDEKDGAFYDGVVRFSAWLTRAARSTLCKLILTGLHSASIGADTKPMKYVIQIICGVYNGRLCVGRINAHCERLIHKG